MRIRYMPSSPSAGTTRAGCKRLLVGAACLALLGGCEPDDENQRGASSPQTGFDAAPGSSGSWDASAQDAASAATPADASGGNHPAAEAGAVQTGAAAPGG